MGMLRILGVFLLAVWASAAAALDIGAIQVYDALDGSPVSPYLGQQVSVFGTVTVSPGDLATDLCWVQDATGGILVHFAVVPAGADKLQLSVSGTVTAVAGELRIEAASAHFIFDLPGGAAPTETAVATVAADHAWTGRLVRLYGVATGVDSTGFDLAADGATIRVGHSTLPFAAAGAVAEADTVAVTGPLRMDGGAVAVSPAGAVGLVVAPPARPYLMAADGSGAFADLAAAFAFVLPGDELTLAPGTYAAVDLTLPRGIVLRGDAADREAVTLDAQGAGRVLVALGRSGAVIRDLTLSNGAYASGALLSVYQDMTDPLTVQNCVLRDGSAVSGGAFATTYASPYFVDCEFRDNVAATGGAGDIDLISGKQLAAGGAEAAAALRTLAEPRFAGCAFRGNQAERGGAVNVRGYDAATEFTDCLFAGNTASDRGGAVFVDQGADPRFLACRFLGNAAAVDGHVVYLQDAGFAGAALLWRATVTANGDGDGSLFAGPEAALRIQDSLVAFNDGESVLAELHPAFGIGGSDVYGNAGGDWAGALAGFAGQDSNFAANPYLCAATGEVCAVASNSPCLPGNHPDGYVTAGVGQNLVPGCADWTDAVVRVVLVPAFRPILHPGDALPLTLELCDAGGAATVDGGLPPTVSGAAAGDLTPLLPTAWPAWTTTYTAGDAADTVVAHDAEALVAPYDTLRVTVTSNAIITLIEDIPDDQGRQVRVRWRADMRDTLGCPEPVTQYVVWRRVEETAAKAARPVIGLEKVSASLASGDVEPDWLLAHAATLWEPVGPAVPAMTWPLYASVVPTLRDSTAADPGRSTFFVSAHTTEVQTVYASLPDSGSSIDNLAPAAPANVSLDVAGFGLTLVWDPNPEPDCVAYRVYRGRDPGAPLAEDELVAVTGVPTWSSPDGAGWYYRLTALDFAGNESPATLADALSDARDGVPARFGVLPNRPNPFNPSTTIVFDLPADGAVHLDVFDLRGLRVCTLLRGQRLTAGRHEVAWRGVDDAGRAVASGTYLLRLRQGARSGGGRLTLTR